MSDIETWQFPVLLTFYPSIAQPVLRYRVDRQDGAAVNARIRRYEIVTEDWRYFVHILAYLGHI